ncbi:MAG: Omp28-related outer membrane protein [Chitinophagales bacterium]|nr:Omp28-related outer membrane protein [Chitinophagales bacterium]
MKRNYIFFISILTIIFSCKEIGPVINTSGNGGNNGGGANVDSTQQRIVLLEDFTATNCPNCPKGRVIIDQLLAAHPGRIEVVEIHQGPLSVQLYPDDPILKTSDGESLASYLGPPPFWPSGAIDRKLWSVSPDQRLMDRNLWTGVVAQELDSNVNIFLGQNFSYDDASRKLTGSVTVNFLNTVTDALNITVLITESGIVAGQLDGLTPIPEYVHHNVLRDILTNYTGDIVSGNKTQGSSWTYNLSPYIVDGTWNADSCRVIALVSKSVGTYDVLQVIGAPLK